MPRHDMMMTTRLMAAASSNGGGDGRKRGGGGKERCNNQIIEATAGWVATSGHSQIAILKISMLCSYKMRWYHVLRGEVHIKYLHEIVGYYKRTNTKSQVNKNILCGTKTKAR